MGRHIEPPEWRIKADKRPGQHEGLIVSIYTTKVICLPFQGLRYVSLFAHRLLLSSTIKT